MELPDLPDLLMRSEHLEHPASQQPRRPRRYHRRPACYSCDMPPKLDDPQAQAATLRIPERFLLFCIASKTEWERAGITGATATAMVIKRLIGRDAAGKFTLTKQGRAVLAAMMMERDE